jgi:hypothetical protein
VTAETWIYIGIGVSLVLNIYMILSYYFVHEIPRRVNDQERDLLTHGKGLDDLSRRIYNLERQSEYLTYQLSLHGNSIGTLKPLLDYFEHKNRMQAKSKLAEQDESKIAAAKKKKEEDEARLAELKKALEGLFG